MNYEVPEKRCARGHVIPLNGEVVGQEKDEDGVLRPIVLKAPRLICEACAYIDSRGQVPEGVKHRPVKGKRLEKLGQESFLNTVPAKFIS